MVFSGLFGFWGDLSVRLGPHYLAPFGEYCSIFSRGLKQILVGGG